MQLPTTWGRWQEHHQSSPEYGMLGHSGMMQYDSRATSSPTVQQPSVATQYMVGNSYSMPSVSSMTAPHYQPHNPFGFQAYPPSTPSPLVAPFRQFSDGRPTLRVMPISSEKAPETSYPRDSMHSNIESNTASPEVKHELHTPPQPARGQDSSVTLTPTSAKNEGNKFENNTFIDNLMRVVQSKLNNKSDDNSPEARYPSPPRGSRSASPEDVKPNEKHPKKYRCDVADCNQKFAQKTHLYIHIRSHTGEKPYPCNHPGCGHYFSQLGNLKTHERRHTGEKPFACEQCGKRFAQRGNVRAHMNVHDPSKRFYCNLDGCGRPFTQRGNLKVGFFAAILLTGVHADLCNPSQSHQNKFHTKTLMELTEKFATMSAAELNSLPKEERKVFDDFAIIYKNLNKGIKGRGRDRNVAPAVPRSHPHNGQSLAGPPSHHLAQQQHTPPMHPHMASGSVPQLPQLPHPAELQHPHHHGLPPHQHHHEGDYHSYVMMRQHQHHQQQHNNPGQQHHMMVGRNTRPYEMMDVDQESLSGSGATPSSTGTFYEEDHNRNLSFEQHRMY
ncbi:C2H2 transcription factor [Apiospora hydei]|uniref:C2H2 transcription factor n=1 Tax=Apiospora hydei TaxID=1337664 RepID=A0ABR1V574_9PEZI